MDQPFTIKMGFRRHYFSVVERLFWPVGTHVFRSLPLWRGECCREVKNCSNLSFPGHGIRSRKDASESNSDDEDMVTSSEEEKETHEQG